MNFSYATGRKKGSGHLQTRDEQLVRESECDGWYIDPPAAWLTLYPPPKPGTFHHLCFGTGERDDYKFTEVGKRETGFALLATRRHKPFFQDEMGRPKEHEGVDREEITEFSESPFRPISSFLHQISREYRSFPMEYVIPG